MPPQACSFDEAVDTLDHFFDRMDSRRLFDRDDPFYFQDLRHRVRHAFFTVLLDGRPRLEACRGLSWPYNALSCGMPFVDSVFRKGQSRQEREQAGLFLALLPFPGQWRRLVDLEQQVERHPEIELLLAEERQKIDAKLRKKRQKSFKLRHFCQILKAPRLPGEKGVLRIFSLPYLFSVPGLLKRLSERYLIYMEPPWGVLARHTWLRVFSDLEDPSLIGAGGAEDCRFLETQPGIVAVPLAHGDYLEEDAGISPAGTKTYDLVFNGLFDDMPRKRHTVLLDLLCRPELRRLTALFIGRGTQDNVAAFRQHVADRGLDGRVAIHDNLPRHDVPRHLTCCRMGVQLSLHENACRSIYEFFRSDIPCLVSSAMAGFNFDLITPKTGAAVPDEALPGAILHMLDHIDQFEPRAWFLRHSGSRNASRRLNHRLRALFEQLGYSWREDIVPLSSSGPNRYTNPVHYQRFLPEFASLLGVFHEFSLPIRIVPE